MRYLYIIIFVFFLPSLAFSNDLQQEFCSINNKYILKSSQTNKELKLQLYKKKRKKEFKKLKSKFNDWNATIVKIGSVGEDYASVEVEVCDKVSFHTSYTEMNSELLIHMDNPIYEILLELDKGSKVKISGELKFSEEDHFKESSFTDRGSLTEPEYYVKFTDIKP